MSYKIYELARPDILKKLKHDGYSTKTQSLIVIKEVECVDIEWSYTSEEAARTAVLKNADKLKHKEIVVLNVMSVNWEGKIS